MIVVIIVAVAAWLLSGSKNEEQIDFKQEAVTTQTLQNSVTATGTIEAVTSVTVGTQVSGIVNKLYVDYNSQVKKGEVIAELDKTNLMSELNTAKANLASAQSSLNYQSANMSRYQTLYKKGLVSADDYENALLTYRQAKEQVASAKENVQKAQTNLFYCSLEYIVRISIYCKINAVTFFYTAYICLVNICNHLHVGQIFSDSKELWCVEACCYGLSFLYAF